jgi:hypothetical protein
MPLNASAASLTEWWHMTIASGAAVIIRFITPKQASPQTTATMKAGLRMISSSGRPSAKLVPLCAHHNSAK